MAAGGLTGRVLIRALLSLISLSIFANAVIGWATARAVGSRFDGTFFSPMCAQVADLAIFRICTAASAAVLTSCSDSWGRLDPISRSKRLSDTLPLQVPLRFCHTAM